MTTHWPPREDEPDIHSDRVWIADGREAAGADLTPGDLVFVYQMQTGPLRLMKQPDGSDRRVRSHRGKGGIIAVAEITHPFEKNEEWPFERYEDGKQLWWCWHAPYRVLSSAGFVPREEVCRILGYDSNYVFRGWGPLNSGLGKLSPEQFESLRARFLSASGEPPAPLPTPAGRDHGTGEESEAHRALKEFVASVPAEALGEEGISHVATEFVFPTNDRADVVLQDRFACVCGVEIEIDVGDKQVEGLLQAIKYRAMLECLWHRRPGEGRAILVAYSISPKMRERCAAYQVEAYEIDRRTVEEWAQQCVSHAG